MTIIFFNHIQPSPLMTINYYFNHNQIFVGSTFLKAIPVLNGIVTNNSINKEWRIPKTKDTTWL